MKINYDDKMQEIIENLVKENKKPKLLMHACCAPCSTFCIERVKDYFDLTIYFYNPNIDTLDEYNKRRDEIIKYCKKVGVKCVTENHREKDYYDIITGLEKEKEGGKRCSKCFYLRLKQSAVYGKENNFDYFTTTLTISPLKNSQLLNEIGEKIEKEINIKWLYSDFKKHDGYKCSTQISRENNMYRQNYCGCIFSKIERENIEKNI